jgi:CheY-like chemotaxis protein
MKVLLVDDDPAMLESVKDNLAVRCDYTFDCAKSAYEATEMICQKDYDAIICDIQMPELDGFEFLVTLRKSGNNIPFIVFTVTDNPETAMKAYQLGANGFVGKFGKPEIVFPTLIKHIEQATLHKPLKTML